MKMVNYNKFEYFINAIHYCMWLKSKKDSDFIWNIIDIIPRHFFTKNFKNKYYERLQNCQKERNKYFNDKKMGFHVGMAHRSLGRFYSCYTCFIGFVLCGCIYKDFHCSKYYDFISCICLAIPIGFGYIPAYKALYKDDRYVKYLKKFEKEDETWHKKWKRITIAFCVGAIVFMILGICAAFAIAIH